MWLGPNAELRLGVDEVEKSGLDRRLGQVCGPRKPAEETIIILRAVGSLGRCFKHGVT